MASATTLVSESAARKSISPVAALFKAAPAAKKEAAAAGSTNADTPAPKFADALKAARRPAHPAHPTHPAHSRRDEAPVQEKPEGQAKSEAHEKPEKVDKAERKAQKHEDRAERKATRRAEKEAGRSDHADDAPVETPVDENVDDLPVAEETPAEEEIPVTEPIAAAEPEAEQLPVEVPAQPIPTDIPPQTLPPEMIVIAETPVVQVAAATPMTVQAPVETVEAVEAKPQPTPAAAPVQPLAETLRPTAPVPADSDELPPEVAAETGPQSLAQQPDARPVVLEPKAPALPKKIQLPREMQLVAAKDAELLDSQPLETPAPQPAPVKTKLASHNAPVDQPQEAPVSATSDKPLPNPTPITAQPLTLDATAPRLAIQDPAPLEPTQSNQQPITATTAAAPAPAQTESADAAPLAQETPAPTPDETFEQVVLGLRGKLDANTGKAEIRLEPPNLGPLHVSVHLKNGTLTAQFQSSSDLVRDLLSNNMEKLKTVLEGQGIAVDKLAVGPTESPADKAVMQAPRGQNFGAPDNDGRSAGQYHRDPSNGHRRSANSVAFAKVWREAAEAPIDLVG